MGQLAQLPESVCMGMGQYFRSIGKPWIPEVLGIQTVKSRMRGEGGLGPVSSGAHLEQTSAYEMLDVQCLAPGPYRVVAWRHQHTLIVHLFDSREEPIPASVELLRNGKSLGPFSTNELGMVCFEQTSSGTVLLRIQYPSSVRRDFQLDIPEPKRSDRLRAYLETGPRMFFMPIVSIHNGMVYGYEALARDLERDQFPGDLFAEAECKGLELMAELDLACIQTALREAANRPWSGGRKIFVNVSPPTFSSPAFAETFMRHGLPLPCWQIVFEIREGMDSAMAREFRTRLAPLFLAGFEFACDDQGAEGTYGQALLFLQTQYVKGDWRFVNDSLDLGRLQALNGYRREAEEMNGRMIIEGVTEDWGARDLSEFYEMGVSYGQGFMFGRAVASDEVPSQIPPEPMRILRQVWDAHRFAVR